MVGSLISSVWLSLSQESSDLKRKRAVMAWLKERFGFAYALEKQAVC